MKKWLLRILYAALVLLPIGAIADYTATPGSGSTVFAFVCFTSKICPAHVLTNSSGTEIATSGNPVRTDPTGTTPQPVTVASPVQTVGPTAVGSANANPPVVIGGTVTGAAGQNVEGLAIKPASTAAAATDLSAVTNESPNSQLSVDMHTTAANSALPLPAQSNHTTNIGAVDSISQYPAGATPLTASATGTTAATTATLAGTTGKTTYVCGYSIRANATANTNVTNTLTGVITGTMSSIMWVPANTAGLGVDEQIFMPCIPASATNTAIAAVSGAPGTGGLVSVKAWGYQQ